MAKAKILADRISITSDILTDENIEKVSILSPSTLYLYDDKDENRILYQVTGNEFNTFTKYGATFKDGKSLGIFESCTELSKQSEKTFGIKLLCSAISSVCHGKQKTHRGYTFKYISKEEYEERTKIN